MATCYLSADSTSIMSYHKIKFIDGRHVLIIYEQKRNFLANMLICLQFSYVQNFT